MAHIDLKIGWFRDSLVHETHFQRGISEAQHIEREFRLSGISGKREIQQDGSPIKWTCDEGMVPVYQDQIAPIFDILY